MRIRKLVRHFSEYLGNNGGGGVHAAVKTFWGYAMSVLRNIIWKITPVFVKKLYYKIREAQYRKLSTKEIFTRIKDKNLWESSESVSGPGSEIEQTKTLVVELNRLLKDKNVKTMLDIPCGDFNWMRKVDLSSVNYTGADIVEGLISENLRKYSANNIKFITMNIITDILPEADLIFVRDCFIHLSYNDIEKALKNIKRSGCKYLLTTSYLNHKNHDIATGFWRPINLQESPFNFPEPEYTLIENCTEYDGIYKDKAMGLWTIEKI
jgi:hypothetical protein